MKIKGIKDIAIELTKREGKKKQVNIAQMNEIMAHLSDMVYEQYDNLGIVPNMELLILIVTFYKNGKRRAGKKGKQRSFLC